MKRILLSIAALLVGAAAFAGTVNLSWTNPTTYTDNTAIGSTDITQTRIEYGSCSGTAFGTKAGQQIVNGSATADAITLAAGTYCFRAYTTALGVESAASSVTTATVTQSAPNPPVLKTVSTTAYIAVGSGRRVAMIPAGTVPKGTVCQASKSLLGLYGIPASAVKARIKSSAYWGKCA